MRRLVGVLVGAAAGAISGLYACTLQPNLAIACGDGYTDVRAGEECDPEDEDSYIGACAGTSRPDGDARCDPTTCTIINDSEQCAACGDGIVDGDEECDGDNLAGKRCPSGDGAVQCVDCKHDFSLCDGCGDRIVDPEQGEECDKANVGGLLIPRACAGSGTSAGEELPPLPSPINMPYTYGEAFMCTDECKLSRLRCSYCNNGQRDDPTRLDEAGNLSPRELCDGDIVDLDAMFERHSENNCWSVADARPNLACADDCLGFEARPGEPDCCKKSGGNCPMPTDSLRCCYEYAHPEATQPCVGFTDAKGQMLSICR